METVCAGCGIGVGEGLKLYSVGDGTYECEVKLAGGDCAAEAEETAVEAVAA